jgi:hypothetical protein
MRFPGQRTQEHALRDEKLHRMQLVSVVRR